MKSISNRIYKTIFLVSITCILILIVTILITNEALETTMLRVVPDDDPALSLTPAQQTEGFIWDGATNKIAFVPAGAPVPTNLPAVFVRMGDQIASEIELEGKTFLVNVQHTADGVLYWARNISAFETRQTYLLSSLFLIVGGIVVFSLLLAIVSSRKIVRPLQQLSGQIAALPVGKGMPPIGVDYTDQELHDIAISFNRFLDELNAYVDREQRLLTLASHELRTPIAVVAGALDVLESRGQLAANDLVTLRRIKTANNEMAENVRILLSLARSERHNNNAACISINDCVTDILRDLPVTLEAGQRVRVDMSETIRVRVQPAMLKMLLRNVIQNALQHTAGMIKVNIRRSEIIISDQGVRPITLPHTAPHTDNAKRPTGHGAGGLGLYIVTLICERLGWSLTVQSDHGLGNNVHIIYGSDAVTG